MLISNLSNGPLPVYMSTSKIVSAANRLPRTFVSCNRIMKIIHYPFPTRYAHNPGEKNGYSKCVARRRDHIWYRVSSRMPSPAKRSRSWVGTLSPSNVNSCFTMWSTTNRIMFVRLFEVRGAAITEFADDPRSSDAIVVFMIAASFGAPTSVRMLLVLPVSLRMKWVARNNLLNQFA